MTAANPAEELREAARLCRERAEEATPGPWNWGGNGVAAGDRMICDDTLESAAVHRDSPTDWWPTMQQDNANGRYMALVHPGVGLALADLLDRAAYLYTHGDVGTAFLEGSWFVARILLGTQPDPELVRAQAEHNEAKRKEWES